MVNALNDGINNCIHGTVSIDLKTPIRGTPAEYPCNDLVRIHLGGERSFVNERTFNDRTFDPDVINYPQVAANGSFCRALSAEFRK